MKLVWILAISCSLSSCFVRDDMYFPLDTDLVGLFPALYHTGDTVLFEMGYRSTFDTLAFVVQEKTKYLTTHAYRWDNGYKEVQQLRLKGEGSVGDIVISIGSYRKQGNNYYDTSRVLEIKCPQNGFGAVELDSVSRTIDTTHYRKTYGAMDFYLDYSTYAGIIKFKDYKKDIQLTRVP